MKKFTIAAAYQWPNKIEENKSPTSEQAIKKIIDSLKKRLTKNNKNGKEITLEFKRLRASAGKSMLDSIIKRIDGCSSLIVDISNKNANVYIELGIAISRARKDNSFSLYLIKEINNTKNVADDLPSDLQGYFISGYTKEKNGIVYKDKNSLLMSLVSDINDYYFVHGGGANTDEINFKE